MNHRKTEGEEKGKREEKLTKEINIKKFSDLWRNGPAQIQELQRKPNKINCNKITSTHNDQNGGRKDKEYIKFQERKKVK